MSSLMKALAIFFLIVGIVSTIIVATNLPLSINVVYVYAVGFIGSLIPFGLFYSIGYGLELLERIANANEGMWHLMTQRQR